MIVFLNHWLRVLLVGLQKLLVAGLTLLPASFIAGTHRKSSLIGGGAQLAQSCLSWPSHSLSLKYLSCLLHGGSISDIWLGLLLAGKRLDFFRQIGDKVVVGTLSLVASCDLILCSRLLLSFGVPASAWKYHSVFLQRLCLLELQVKVLLRQL